MNNADNDYIVIAKIGATYGIKGWLKIVSFTETIDQILNYRDWYISKNNHWESINVTEAKEYGKGIIAKLAGFNTPEDARLLTGKKIAIRREALPILKEQEYYWADLEGLTVINQTGEELGKVIYLMATGSNDVLVVKGKKEHGIPYLPEKVIKKVDLVARIIYVDWEII